VRIPYLAPVKRQPGFILRVEADGSDTRRIVASEQPLIRTNSGTNETPPPRPRLRA